MCVRVRVHGYFEVLLQRKKKWLSEMATKPLIIKLIGDSFVGKSSLLIRYQQDVFPDASEWLPTIAEHYVTDIECKFENGESRKVAVDIWDTNTHDEFDRGIHYARYENVDVILLCFSINARESLEILDIQYMNEMWNHCRNVPFLLIGCKNDLRIQQIWTNMDMISKLIHGYIRGQSDMLFDIYGIMGEYLKQSDDEGNKEFVTDDEAQAFCDRIGGYRYLSCSALEGSGIREIFEVACKCFLEPDIKHNDGCECCQIL